MILETVTLLRPDGTSVTLGAPDLDAVGGPNGYTLTGCVIDPAPIVTAQTNMPLVAGGIVSGGRYGIRTIELDGMIVAANATDSNTLRRELVGVLTDVGEGETITLRYTVDAVDRELSCLVSDGPSFTDAGGNYIRYSVTLVAGDPVALSYVPSSASAGITSPGVTMTNTGDARVWPEVTVTFLDDVTAFRLTNSTTGHYIEVTGIAATDTSELIILNRPGYEEVSLDGVSILDKLEAGSRFTYLAPGANGVYVTDKTAPSASNVRATVEWRAGWVS